MEPISLETRLVSSLVKVFADEELKAEPWMAGTALRNETYSFQVAYRCGHLTKPLFVKASTSGGSSITLREIGLVPSEMPCYHRHDEGILRSTPGLYPDPLLPIKEGRVVGPPQQWRSVWVTVHPGGESKGGEEAIHIVFTSGDGEKAAEETFTLTRLEADLPKQRLLHTEWFHADCLATYYGDEVFSEKHWVRIRQFIRTAAEHGMNMILTPLFTPPLDTEVGGERPTVQLVDVKKTGSAYSFGYERLERWISLCEEEGIPYLEMSHLFTQWGAKHAPKIIAEVDGTLQQIFGWDTDAAGPEYEAFLDAFLPDLIAFLQRTGWEDKCYFHISDEPNLSHLESYSKASALIRKHLDQYPIIDALSDATFYDKGLVKQPIPANNHIEPFVERKLDELWTYYCCSQHIDVPNRFFHMPSSRNRIMGVLSYVYNLKGFLHWGYNFWYSQYSKYPIDPYRVTDAGHAFPSGDAFLVYPGEDGPVESIRLEVMSEALQDLRALELLEETRGREKVLALIEQELGSGLSMTSYPLEERALLNFREKVNREIASAS
ncbi:DUF4091 domain-containing protein [Paenibacillus aurantius]|uniref:DUF4091 domain-containing protein n=1 Tax=Paenibacillus aurantius TaxID=2918900 RepID=A0AA96LC10_9BACL|nr:DUF4091 domain-containing protein [Paenibacillus aurantius]WNQ09062.1 DUF4091 domain-containing protein [Paenibacillus aurantius]